MTSETRGHLAKLMSEDDQMTGIVRCEGCGKQLRLSERMAGRQVACPACRTTISLPESFSSPTSDRTVSPTSNRLTEGNPQAPSRKLPGPSNPISSVSESPAPVSQPTPSPDASSEKKPARSPAGPRRPATPQRGASVDSSTDPFGLSSDLIAADPVAASSVTSDDSSNETPFSAMSLSVGSASTASSGSRRSRSKKKKPSNGLMVQYGLGLGLFAVALIVILVVLARRGNDTTDASLKQLVRDQFFDCEKEALLEKVIDKHHQHCVDVCTDHDAGTIDQKRYENMMRKRVTKDLRANGLRY